MSEHSIPSETFGSKALTFAIIIGSALLLLAVLASPGPQTSAVQTAQAQPAMETAMVTAS